MLCYIWFHKKYKKPYLSIMDANLLNDPRLLMEDRKRAGILLINPDEDLPIDVIKEVVTNTLELFKNGTIKTKDR